MRNFPRSLMILTALAPLALAGAIAGPAAGATATPSDTPAACSTWNGAQPVNPGTNSIIWGVAPVSACDAWAVGASDSHALIERWTGGSWATVDLNLPGISALFKVSAVSASDIWAAGTTTPDPNLPENMLFLHYNGSTWTQVDSNITAPDAFTLLSLDARAANDAWLAGYRSAGPRHSVIMHWNGSHWNPSSVPQDFAGDNTQVNGISADSATDAWAAGNDSDFGSGAFMLRWDGSRWNPVDISVPASTTLTGVTALSPDNAWAVGYTQPAHDPDQPVIMHWDGAHWAQMTSPNVGGAAGSALDEVTATSATNVFVRASYLNASSLGVTVVLHWDGSSWAGSALPLPGQGAGDIIQSIGVSGAGQAWIAGSTGLHGNPLTTVAAPVPVVPDVSGDLVGEANATLGTFGLTGSSALNETMNCPPSSYGLIVGQDPAAGQQEPFGFAVSLTKCVNPPTVAVPNVLSEDNTSARNAITAAGLTVGSVSMVANCTASFGVVLNQNPNGGVQVPPGSAVNLTESTGKQANGRPCIQN